MDIASRIKTFLDTLGIPNSQFADTCGIPRPSLSQLLNGRNKKVSDEVIGKIHNAYPNLSILWLMFGEGDLVTDSNIEISDGENAGLELPDDDESFEEQGFIPTFDSIFNVKKTDASGNNNDKNAYNRQETAETTTTQHIPAYVKAEQSNPTLSLNLDSTRRVVTIMVFYSDKSFETFVPQNGNNQ